MELTDDQLHDALAALTEDGDRYAINDTFELRLTIEHDDDGDINHYECYGRTEKFSHRYSDGKVDRPADMDGAARKIEVDRGDYIWWQPAEDMTSAKKWGGPPDEYAAVFRTYVEQVTELLQWGFSILGVEVWQEVEDVHGHTHKIRVDSAYIGGVDSTKPEHITDLVSDRIADLADL